jgi:hypothetical protein
LWALLAVWSPPASGQGVSPSTPADLKAAYDKAFLDMYADPGNLDKTFEFAALATKVGDFEGAIGALERMLVIDNRLPRVRLELGVLYFRLASYETAYAYFQEVLAEPDLPEDVRLRVTTFIDELDQRTNRHRFDGTLYGGLRYQTNANAGPGNSEIRLFGFDASLNDQFTEQPDYDAFVSARINYSYDMQTEPRRSIDAELSFYGAEQQDQSQISTRYVEFRVGPRFQVPPELIDGLSVRPYGAADYISLGREETFKSAGGGIDATYILSPRWSFNTDLLNLYRQYNDSTNSIDQSELDGYRGSYSVGGAYNLSGATRLSLAGTVTREETRTAGQNNWEYALTGAVRHSFAAPLNLTDRAWAASLSVSGSMTEYDGPNSTIDPDVTRNDETLRLNLLLTVPVTDDLALIATAGYTLVDSNLPNYEYDNYSASVGVIRRF